MTLYTQVANNRIKTWLFMLVYVILILALGYAAAWYFGNESILLIVAIFVIIQGVVSYWFSDKIALSVSGALPLDSKLGARVYRLVENLSITAGLPMPSLFIIPDESMNAFATGRDTTHSALALTQGLVDRMDDNELSGVIAHELSHVGNEDIKLMSVVMVLAGLIALVSDWMMRSFIFGNRNDRDSNSSPLLMLAAVILSILAPITATLVQLAISRKREFMADADAILLTRYPEGLISALRKLSGDNAPMQRTNKAMAPMYINNPLKGGLISNLFSTHPPIEERIEALEKGSGLK